MGSNPTLSAILNILWRPEAAWAEVRAGAPSWRRSLFGLTAPLALLPAVSWPLGHAADPMGPDAAAYPLAALGAVTYVLFLAMVVIAAAALYVVAPVFSATQHWDRSMAVAAYSAVPVLLASPLLASATLTILLIVAFIHACVLCAIGVRQLLDCRGEDAAMYVAAAGFVAALAGMILGALSSAAGIL